MNKLFTSSLITLGILFSFVFFLIIMAMLISETINLPLAIGLTIVINTILFFISPWISDWINRFVYKVRFLNEDEVRVEFPAVATIIDRVITEHNYKFPKVGIIPDRNPTAFTYGSGRYNSRIVITEGITHYLSDDEAQAVIAHELGHVTNRDFLVMMIATTLIQIMYEIYVVFRRARGRKSGGLQAIALVAYIMYWISTYLLLYLSRTREYLADAFAARYVHPQHLANALIKIAYGIVAAEDAESTQRLLHSTRHLGILDVKNAKHVGVMSYITHNDPKKLAEVMVYDRVSPWAFIIELNSTHPLTGKRIDHLSSLAKGTKTPFAYDIDAARERLNVDQTKLTQGFALGVLVYYAPVITTLLGLLFLPLPLVLVATGIGMLLQVMYRFPTCEAQATTVLDMMCDPYASPIRGKVVALNGTIIGRGTPGYIFSEDVMLQDATGMTFLDFSSWAGAFGNFFFALTKVQALIGKSVTAEGWFFRHMSSMVSLKQVTAQSQTIHSHPILWSIISSLLVMAAGIGLWVYLR